MNSSGMLSNCNSYINSVNSVYSSSRTSIIEKKQNSLDEKTSTDNSANAEINDEAIISDEAKNLLAAEESQKQSTTTAETNEKSKKDEDESTGDIAAKAKEGLTQEEKQEVAKLKSRDAEVKTHEQAHQAAAAGISASAPNYTYETGPDGKKYAVGGEVQLSFVMDQNPEANIQSAQTMKAAALAPANPSSQDLAVARHADQIIQQEKQKISEQKAENKQETTDSTTANKPEKETEQPQQTASVTQTNITTPNISNQNIKR